MAVCCKCGTTTADTWRICRERGEYEYVCIQCERNCEHYSGKLLPNGCNCRLTYSPKNYYKTLCNSEEFHKNYEIYKTYSTEQLRERFKLLKERYQNDEFPKQRGAIRAELAAIKEILDSRKKSTYIKNNHLEDLDVIKKEYELSMSHKINGQIRQDILYYLNEGLTPELIIEVIRATARIQKQWNWSLGVLRNCRNEGKTTAEDFLNKKTLQNNDTIAAYDLDLFERMLSQKR